MVMDADGTNLRQLVPLERLFRPAGRASYMSRYVPGPQTLRPEWSPDRATVLVSVAGWVSVVGTDGSGVRTGIHGAYGSWSPDGSRIAISAVAERGLLTFEGRETDHTVLFTVAADGSDRQVLVRTGRRRLSPEVVLVAANPPPKPWYRFW